MLKEIEYSETPQDCVQMKVSHVIDLGVPYVKYKISLETNDPSFTSDKSTTCRRYSEFRILHNMLVKQFPFKKFPSFPPKAPFKKTFDIAFIQKREAALQDYLEQLCSEKVCLSSRAFHLFLQSSLSMTEIKNVVNGKVANVEETKSVVDSFKSFISGLIDESEVNSTKTALNGNSCFEASNVSDVNLVSNKSSPGSKRVSFCDQVTVAEIHVT